MSVKRSGLVLAAVSAIASVVALGTLGSAPGLAQRASRPSYCPAPSKILNGVYHPSRLHVLAPCQRATGTVRTVRHETDGDLHIDVQLTPAFQKLLNSGDVSKQHGWLVVEFMARDGGHLPAPSVGDAITIVGAWVLDTEHAARAARSGRCRSTPTCHEP